MTKVDFQRPSWILVEEAPFGTDPESGLAALEVGDLPAEEVLGLFGLVLELSVDSETPVVKLLEAQPTSVNLDKVGRRRYLLSGSIKAFRDFYLEYKEQKVAKALLVFLCEAFRSLFEDLWPKHGILPPLGISFRALGPEEVQALDLPLRLRHHYVLTRFRLARGELLGLLLEHRLDPVLLRPQEERCWLVPSEVPKGVEEVADKYLEFLLALSADLRGLFLPQAAACEGFLFAPLLTYMALFTRILAVEGHPLGGIIRELLSRFKEKFPESFGLLPD